MSEAGDRPDPAAPPEYDPDADRVRRLHERTGEIELVISGALLFGLLQLPGPLLSWWDGVTQTLSWTYLLPAFVAFTYVRMIVLTLTIAFAVHLVARAYWVGLIGLDSVFPEGIDWDQIRYGPLAKRVYRERVPKLSRMVRRADDVGSSIFSVAFWIITIFVLSIGFGVVLGSTSLLLTATVLSGLEWWHVFVVLVTLLGFSPALVIGLEKALGGRIPEGSRLARAIERFVAASYRWTGGPLFMSIQFTLFSRIPKRVIWPSYLALLALLITGFFVSESARTGAMAFAATERLPSRPGARSIVADHYATTRSQHSVAPYVQSDIVTGPYVRLTVPLVSTVYLDRLEEACPDLPPTGRSGLRSVDATDEPPSPKAEADALRCLGGIWSVSLDGQPLTSAWDFVWSGSVVRAIAAYLPTAGMEPGAHVLAIERAPAPAGSPGADDDGDGIARYFIRFRI